MRALLLLLVACSDKGITVHNAAPEANIVSPGDGEQVAEGASVPFVGTVSDPDGDALTAAWLAGDTVLCGPQAPLADGTTTCQAALAAGQETVTLVAQDDRDASGEDAVTLQIVANGVPTANISLPDADATYYADELIPFQATVADVEDSPSELLVAWTSSLDGALYVADSPDDDGVVSGSMLLSAGQHEITLSVTDTADHVGTDSTVVTILPANSAPSCEITAPADNSLGQAGDVVTFEGHVSDADQAADTLSLQWSSDLDGGLNSSVADSAGDVSFTTTALSQGTHVITLQVVDDLGATCTDDVLYSVGTPPTITLSSPSDGDVVNVGEDLSFRATVADPDGVPADLSMSWESDVDGVFSTQGPDSGGNISFTSDALSRATHAITATVTDADGLYARAQVGVRVNGLPSAPSIVLGPDPAYTADDLAVTIASGAVDPDGDTVSYSYAWSRDGVPRGAYTTDTVPASATTKGQVWSVVVTPSDGVGDGATDTASVTVQNSLPTAPTVSVDPDDPVEGEDDFQCVVDVDSTDDDGDTISYTVSWEVDGSGFSGAGSTDETGDTIDAGDTTAEEEWVCTVTPDDGTADGADGTATVYVLGVPIDYAHVQYPCSASIARTTGTLDVYTWVYQPGVTDDYGEGAGITVDVGVGDDGTDPETDSSWTWTSAAYNTDQPAYGDSSGDPEPYNNDEYMGTLSAPSTTGSFDYAARVSTDSGLSWTYVDLGGVTCGGDGTIDGYDAADAGDLTVTP